MTQGLGATPWVDRNLRTFWERVEDIVGADWMPKMAGVKAVEYGCGHYGCVMPTQGDSDTVCKLTTDESEAFFVGQAIELGNWDEARGIVEYKRILKLPATHRGRDVYMLWREGVEEVGLRPGAHPYRSRQVLEALNHVAVAATVVQAMYRRAKSRDAWLETLVRANGFEAWAYQNVSHDMDLRYGWAELIRGPQKLALALRLYDLHAELAQHTDGPDAIGQALGFYMERGIVLADVHANNVGLRTGTDTWVITDPGHAVPIHEDAMTTTVEEV